MCLGQTFEAQVLESGESVTGPGFPQGNPEFKKSLGLQPLVLALEDKRSPELNVGSLDSKDVGDLQSISYWLQCDQPISLQTLQH